MPTAEEQAALDAAAAEETAAEAAGIAAAKAANGGETEDEEFDKDRALATIKKQRESEAAHKKRADELAAKLKEHEDAKKTQEERDAEAKAESERKAQESGAEVLRLRAAMKYGLDEEDLDLLGTGSEEQIDARAKRLAERSGGGDEDDVKRRPRERLKTGAASKDEPDKSDPKSLAADVSRGW